MKFALLERGLLPLAESLVVVPILSVAVAVDAAVSTLQERARLSAAIG